MLEKIFDYATACKSFHNEFTRQRQTYIEKADSHLSFFTLYQKREWPRNVKNASNESFDDLSSRVDTTKNALPALLRENNCLAILGANVTYSHEYAKLVIEKGESFSDKDWKNLDNLAVNLLGGEQKKSGKMVVKWYLKDTPVNDLQELVELMRQSENEMEDEIPENERHEIANMTRENLIDEIYENLGNQCYLLIVAEAGCGGIAKKVQATQLNRELICRDVFSTPLHLINALFDKIEQVLEQCSNPLHTPQLL